MSSGVVTSGLHHDRDDHRPSAGSFVDEPSGRPPHVALKRLDVAHAVGECIFDCVGDCVAGRVEQVFGFRRVDPPTGDDLGPDEHLAGLDIDGHNDDHNAFFGQFLPVAQHSLADVTNDPIDVEVARRNAADRVETPLGKFDDVAVFAQQHALATDAHHLCEAGVGHHVAVLPMDRYVPLRVDDREVCLDVVGLRMTGGVHVPDAGVHDFGAEAQQPVDHPVDIALVAGDGVARQHHGVVLAELQELVLPTGHQAERRHRLALRAR